MFQNGNNTFTLRDDHQTGTLPIRLPYPTLYNTKAQLEDIFEPEPATKISLRNYRTNRRHSF